MFHMDVSPATSELKAKHAWVIRHDELAFGSG